MSPPRNVDPVAACRRSESSYQRCHCSGTGWRGGDGSLSKNHAPSTPATRGSESTCEAAGIAADRQRQGKGEQRCVVHPADGRLGHGQAEPDGTQQEQPVA